MTPPERCTDILYIIFQARTTECSGRCKNRSTCSWKREGLDSLLNLFSGPLLPLRRLAAMSPRDPYALDPSLAEDPPASWSGRLKYLGPGLVLTASIVGSGEL